MPETAVVLSDDAIGQIFVIALLFLIALYVTIKRAVAAALRQERAAADPEAQEPSIDHYGG